MSSHNKELIEKICADYRQHWDGALRPSMSDFLDQVPQEDEPQLVAALMAVDLERYQLSGERPSQKEYDSLSDHASAIVNRELNRAFLDQSLTDSEVSFQCQNVTVVEGSEDDFESRELKFNSQTHGAFADKEYHSQFAGRYKLIKPIGEGGMGAVWMADQQAPVRRRVALKFIRPELGSSNAIARFEAERQAIAIMEHPNIAKILDAGETEQGNPYFVMELVKGMPLNEYCDSNRLTIRQRLELMVPICNAVQHAHQKGIIHRDLKHSNVLVADGDDGPVPKVIDFGLAKALEHQRSLTDKTMVTEAGNVVGTLNYMSPEQAGLANHDIDTRSDIYSLGVMIYKLLTGSTPLQEISQPNLSFVKSLKKIREHDAVRPSVWVNNNPESLTEVCNNRMSNPDSLKKLLAGDLDWIVTKALEKDRRLRYQTASELSTEVQRFLNDEKIAARPPSLIYGTRKFVNRNKGLVAALAAFTTLLVSGILTTSLATVWALKERDRANERTEYATGETTRAIFAKQAAEKSERTQKTQLHSMLIKSAWSDWQLGNAESAWQTINKVDPKREGWETRFLRTEFNSNEDVFYGHARSPNAVVFSKDGTLIVSAADDNSIKIWNALSRQLVKTLLTTDAVTCVGITPDSRTIVSGDRTNHIAFWDVESGAQINELGPFAQDVTALKITDDGELLIIGTSDQDSIRVNSARERSLIGSPKIRIFDIARDKTIQEIEGHLSEIVAVDASHDGSKLLSASRDGAIKTWTKKDGQYELMAGWETSNVNDVVFSPDSTLIASCSDELVRIWKLDGKLAEVFAGHTGKINSVSFSNDGRHIVSTSDDKTARIWTLSGEKLLQCNGHFGPINDAIFSPDDQEVITVSDDDTVRVWNAIYKPSTFAIKAHQDVVWSADFSQSGMVAAAASEDRTVSIIDIANGKLVGEPIKHEAAVLSVQFSPNGKQLVTAGADNMIRVWNSTNGKLIKRISGHTDFVWDVSFSPDGNFLASASADKTARIWKTSDWTIVKTIEAHDSELASARYSNDGNFLVTASDDCTIKIWDAKAYELSQVLKGHKNAVWRAVFSPSDKIIASSGYNGEILFWDTKSGKLIRRCEDHSDQVAGLAFSKDGRRVFSASDDKTLRIWDVGSGRELFVLRDKGNSPIVHCSLSDDGTKLISGNAAGFVTIRTANDSSEECVQLLPHEAASAIISGSRVLNSPLATQEDFEHELEIARLCCRFLPSFDAFTNRGMAEFRTGNYEEAVESLKEASRLEAIQYAQPDLRPNIEAHLCMSLFKLGRLEEAKHYRSLFDEKRSADLWLADKTVLFINSLVERVFSEPVLTE